MKYCRPQWLFDERDFRFQIAYNDKKKLNFFSRQPMQISMINRCLLRNYLKSALKKRSPNFKGFWKIIVLNVFNYKK